MDATTRPRLTRSRSDRVIAGVAGGLGAHTGLDPVIFRIGFVALALTGGLGVMLYILAALFIPREGDPPGSGRAWTIVGLGILFLGGLAILGALLSGFFFMADPVFAARHLMRNVFEVFGSTLLIAGALLVVGYLLLREDRGPRTRSRPEAPAVPHRGLADALGTVRRARSPLPWLTLAALLVAVGTVAALDNAGTIAPRVAVYPGVALIVTGLGLITATRWGRARLLLVPLGLLLVPATVLASATDLPLHGRIGSFYEYPSEPRDLDARYEILAGELHLDLSPLRDLSEDLAVDVTQVAGSLSLSVPPGMGLRVTGEIDAGAYDNWLRGGRSHAGVDVVVDETRPARAGFGTVTVSFRQGVGSVTIMRAVPEFPLRGGGGS